MKIRIKFAKYGVMKFIGHLDVMRFFQKAVRRAEIDIKYSEGFNPHQIMSFAAPLGVGIESTGEYMDIEVCSMSSAEALRDALNKVMVDGISILSVCVLPDHAKNAMASVAAARYRIACRTADSDDESFPIEDIDKKLESFYAQAQIPVMKKTKKGESELDIKSGIYELFMEDNKISMLVNASSSGNIKPSLVLDAFFKYCHAQLSPFSYGITRIETYANPAKEGEPMRLVPLDAIEA